MTLTDIKLIESGLSVNLPEELVEKYTSSLLDGIEEFPEISGLFILEPSVIIDMNQKLRRKGLWKKPFPEHLFLIGYDGKNEYFLVDLRENPLRVFRVMNNKAWRYSPDNLENNLVCSVPGNEGIDSFIEILPLFHLRMKQDQEPANELKMSESETTGGNTYKMLEDIADEPFDTIDWSQMLSGTMIEKFLTTEIDLWNMSIVDHGTDVMEMHYESTPGNAIIFASTGVDGCHYCIVNKPGASIEESPVYHVSPMDGEGTVIWTAKDFIDFLSIGVAMGSFTYISSCHSCDNEEFEDLVEESWSEDDVNKKKETIKLLEEHFPLRNYDDLFKHITESYEDRNNHVELSFRAMSDIKEVKLGYYNRV